MHLTLVNPKPDRRTTVSRDHMGGFGFEMRSPNLTPPLTLAYTAAVAEHAGHRVSLFDAVALDWGPAHTVDRIVAGAPDAVGVLTATPSIQDDLAMATAVKARRPEATVLLLGSHATMFHEDALRNSRADGVVRGEPEYTVTEICDRLSAGARLDGVEGLTHRWRAEVLVERPRADIADLDALPFPARHLLPMDVYQSAVMGIKPFTTILASRGCYYTCTYCPYPVGQGKEWRARSDANVVAEVEHVVREYGVREILFRDPLFTADRRRAVRIANAIRDLALPVIWRCETRLDLIDEEIVAAFAEGGCRWINFGVESASDQVLDNVTRRRIPVEKMERIFRACRRHGIETMAFLIFGLPGETRDTAEESINLALRLDPDVAQFTAATPFPETAYYHHVRAQGLLQEDWSLFTSRSAVVGTESLTPEDLDAIIRRAYRRFYWRPSYLARRARQFRDPRQRGRLWRGLLSVLAYSGITSEADAA